MAKPSARAIDASARILDVAERLVQTRGFNGFSYADVAEELSLTKASLHYHFPSKADLGAALIARYRDVFSKSLEAMDRENLRAVEKLERYAELYEAVLVDGRMCLCGMVAAEYATLPKNMQEEIRRFFTANEVWLAKVIEAGARSGELQVRGTPLDTARFLVSALEGAMLVARTYRSVERFEEAARRLLAELSSTNGRAGTARSTRRAARRPRSRQLSD